MNALKYFSIFLAVPALLVMTKITRLEGKAEYERAIEQQYRGYFSVKSRTMHVFHHDQLQKVVQQAKETHIS